ncbi:MAG: CDGSH iron-sulfur domain-containing protein [Anaerolineae bacterium]
MSSKTHRYESPSISVDYELKRCIHAEECIQRLSAVFDRSSRRWIQPENASADAIAETIEHCPTGALRYTRKDDGAAEAKPAKNTIRLGVDGALYIRADLQMRDEQYYRVALCRCGASKNKPFCDNSHKDIHFTTNGLVDEAQRELHLIEDGGTLTITPEANGPYWVQGNFEIIDANGEVVYTSSEQWLCRCGGSANKPFCDSTHKKIGFQAE